MSSPEAGWVTIALLGKTRGNRGEITAFAFSQPGRYAVVREVCLFGGSARDGRRLEVETAWFHGGVLVFKFRGIDTISDAERLTGAEVRIPIAERVPLEPDEFFESDLTGCEVVDRRTGEALGRITRFQDAGGCGLLEIDGDWLIPFARSICVEIDPAAKRVAVELPEGLRDLNKK